MLGRSGRGWWMCSVGLPDRPGAHSTRDPLYPGPTLSVVPHRVELGPTLFGVYHANVPPPNRHRKSLGNTLRCSPDSTTSSLDPTSMSSFECPTDGPTQRGHRAHPHPTSVRCGGAVKSQLRSTTPVRIHTLTTDQPTNGRAVA